MTPPVPRETDPVLEALIALARSAIANRKAAADRRDTMTVVQGGKRDGGRAA